jgi:hypothetical protein
VELGIDLVVLRNALLLKGRAAAVRGRLRHQQENVQALDLKPTIPSTCLPPPRTSPSR